MIGVVISDIENPHFTQMVRAVEDAAYRRGYRVVLCNTDEDPAKQRDYLGVLAAERIAGAIISATEADAPEISELIDQGTCVVAYDRAVADRRADAVLSANVEGARMGTEHLIAGGHKNIGFISGPTRIETAAERLSGYDETISARPASAPRRFWRFPLRRWRPGYPRTPRARCHRPARRQQPHGGRRLARDQGGASCASRPTLPSCPSMTRPGQN